MDWTDLGTWFPTQIFPSGTCPLLTASRYTEKIKTRTLKASDISFFYWLLECCLLNKHSFQLYVVQGSTEQLKKKKKKRIPCHHLKLIQFTSKIAIRHNFSDLWFNKNICFPFSILVDAVYNFQFMILNCIWWWGSCSADLESVEYPLIAITPNFTLTRSSSTC